jgi:hypothetical protein
MNLIALDAEPAGADIIDRLEEVLELARKGELSSVAIATVYRDGAPGRSWSTPPSHTLLIGSVARLQHALNIAADE